MLAADWSILYFITRQTSRAASAIGVSIRLKMTLKMKSERRQNLRKKDEAPREGRGGVKDLP